MACNICLKEYKNIIRIITTCNHTFCLDCLSKLNKCPYCRKDLKVEIYFEKEEDKKFVTSDFYYTDIGYLF